MSDDARSAVFDFARQLVDDRFRAYLARNGYVQGLPVVVVENDASPQRVAELAEGYDPPVLLARRDPAAPYGWRLRLLGSDGTQWTVLAA